MTDVTVLSGDDGKLVQNSCKVMRFKIRIPQPADKTEEFHGTVTLTFRNEQFNDNHHVAFCGAQVVKSGDNVACVRPASTVATPLTDPAEKEYQG